MLRFRRKSGIPKVWTNWCASSSSHESRGATTMFFRFSTTPHTFRSLCWERVNCSSITLQYSVVQDVLTAYVNNRLHRWLLVNAAQWERDLIQRCQFSVYSSNTLDYCVSCILGDVSATMNQAKQVMHIFEDVADIVTNYRHYRLLVLTIDFLLVVVHAVRYE